ncbi:MAG TPA: threonine--tRNA ligase [Candidatus Thermoplasmatota archaeon]|nr:threonine--tRNA ligase [Candidatus Thermoplasmatota archaeon]
MAACGLDFIEYTATKKALKAAPEITDAEKAGRMEECLCAFVSVEKADEAGLQSAVRKAAAEIVKVAEQVKTNRVMLYPYAHLSNSLASPAVALQALPALKAALPEGFEVQQSPFGWYKAFSIKCKGHPLSELSRHVLPDEHVHADGCCGLGPAGAGLAVTSVSAAQAQARASAKSAMEAPSRRAAPPEGTFGASGSPAAAAPAGASASVQSDEQNQALKAEKTLKSQWFVLSPDGSLTPAEEFDFAPWPGLAKFYAYEKGGSRKADQEPAHIPLMQQMELVDYEPGSDSGNMRWFPKGQLIKRLLEEKINRVCRDAGGLQIETPIMYDVHHPALNKYLNKFPARQYRIQSDEKELFLRFAACFGMYLTMGRSTLSYKHLPARIYELTHYSFRREQSGETAGIKRLRCFTMPDMHTLVADLDQAREEFKRQFDRSKAWMDALEVPYETAVRFVRSFYEQNKDFAVSLARTVNQPVLVEMWEQQSFYFVMKFEFNFNDSVNKAFALSTVQIDTQNPENFGIQYTATDGSRRTPYLLHASLSGAIDRNLCAMLEHQAMQAKAGAKPSLPFWLSPTQVRFLPLNDSFLEECVRLATEINRQGFRADVDDSGHGVGRKIAEAEKEWVPVIVVVGQKEKDSGRYAPRVRNIAWLDAAGLASDTPCELGDLVNICDMNTGSEPKAPLPLPMLLSQRPIFRG